MKQGCRELPILQLLLYKMTRSLCPVLRWQWCDPCCCTVTCKNGSARCFLYLFTTGGEAELRLQWQDLVVEQRKSKESWWLCRNKLWKLSQEDDCPHVPVWVPEGSLCWLATWVLLRSNWLVSLWQQHCPVLHWTLVILTLGCCTKSRQPSLCLRHTERMGKWKVGAGRMLAAKPSRACKEGRPLMSCVANMSPWCGDMQPRQWQLDMESRGRVYKRIWTNLPQKGFGQISELIGSRHNTIFNVLEVNCYFQQCFKPANDCCSRWCCWIHVEDGQSDCLSLLHAGWHTATDFRHQQDPPCQNASFTLCIMG